MQSKFLEKRVDILERTVGGLSELPARVAIDARGIDKKFARDILGH